VLGGTLLEKETHQFYNNNYYYKNNNNNMPRNQGTSRKGKPKKNERAAGMGRSLQKSGRKKHIPSASLNGMAMREGVDSINIQKEENKASVLDINDLDDFLIQAEMANREFASQKEQYVMLDATAQQADDEVAVPWEQGKVRPKSSFAFHELSVPRRPAWDETTTPAELDRQENDAFLEWRRAIALKEEEIVLSQEINSSIGVTPFEKNLEIWRQLWRVMERVSCVVQVVDARNPQFYLSKDLKAYATEELGKPMVLLINKSDYLTSSQRKAWHQYFSNPEHPWEHVFFSAHDEQAALDLCSAEEHAAEDDAAEKAANVLNNMGNNDEDDDMEDDDKSQENLAEQVNKTPSKLKEAMSCTLDYVGVENPLTRQELLDWLWQFSEKNHCEVDPKYNRHAFGMVGFPNVGKSSVINVLMGNATSAHGVVRVGVASQPGKTKHFQTLLLPDRDNMMLCDCPGLVFPSFVNNTADLIAAGVYPIAQMRDPFPVVDLLCRRIPRQVLNARYGIQIPMPTADAMLASKDGSIPHPTVDEFLTTYCVARSMLTSSSGVPDFQRASRIIIKEYAAGRLLYCHAPPNCDDALYQKETLKTAIRNTKKLQEKLAKQRTVGSSVEKEMEAEDDDDVSDDDEDEKSEEDGDNIEDDDMLMELMGVNNSVGTKANANERPKKWGKKGRKLRNKDPYGCHSSPDDLLAGDTAPLGVTVNSGKKHILKNYVRPTGYGTSAGRAVLG
jgi:large subunit GTPase 1